MKKVSKNFVELHITEWEEALKLTNLLPENWIFRGQENVGWDLATSLERCERWDKGRSAFHVRRDAERRMIRDFKQQGYAFLEKPPRTYDDLDWLCILQHHGCYTRLLDFTNSFYIASFFASEKSTNDAVVWAIDRRYLGQSLMKRALNGGFPGKPDIQTYTDKNSDDEDISDKVARMVVKNVLHSDDQYLGVIPVQSSRFNDRMIAQQGLFLFPLGLSTSLESQLCYSLQLKSKTLPTKKLVGLEEIEGMLPQNKPMMIKVVIPQYLQTEITCDLRRMNITAATLFPGLDGFARSLNYHATGYRAINNPPF